MDIKITVKDKYIEDALQSAPGGIRYWATGIKVAGMHITLTERDTGLTFTDVGHLGWERAIKLMAEGPKGYQKSLANLLANFTDQDDADILVQLAVFGEVKYG